MAQQPTQAQTVGIPTRLPLVVAPSNRDDTTNKDAKLVNCYTETLSEKELWIYKRPGLSSHTSLSGIGRGVYNWRGDLYSIFGSTLHKNGTPIAGSVDTTAGVYHFTQTLGTTQNLVLGNGVKAYTYDGATLAQIIDVDFPAAFVKGWAYLDGTTYVMTSLASIRGSDINAPASWDPLNSVIAQIEPDGGVALAKQLVYVVAFKQWTTEIFYDAGNPVGSPLGRVQGAKVNFGCITAGSVQDIDGILLWASTNRSAGAQVVLMDQMRATAISTKPIERLLDQADFTITYSWTMQFDGHRFYVLTLKNSNLTLVYDLDEQRWHQWTDVNGNYFPIVSATYSSDFKRILQHESDGKLYECDASFVTDAGSIITADIYTPNFDGGTRRRKQMKFMEFIGDQVTGSELSIRKNDADYEPSGWSNFRVVDLSKQRPFLTDCGTFVRRAHNLRHQSNTKMRLQAVEMQLDLGTL
jgi:hypothetical protein